MFLVYFALRRPYAIFASVILVCLLGAYAIAHMAIDIFPEINIPVVSVVWQFPGMSAEDIQNRIVTIHERTMASLVDDVARIEANSYSGVGVIRLFLHEGADVSKALTQLGSTAQYVMKYLPRNVNPPLLVRFGATDVPIIQLSVSSSSVPDTELNDVGQNLIRPTLANVRGTSLPSPYGGKPRVIMVDLDTNALQAHGISPAELTATLSAQNVIAPSGDIKMGDTDYMVMLNNSPDVINALNQFPVKHRDGATVFMKDVAYVHKGYQIQTNSVTSNGKPGSLMVVRKTGGASTLDVINGVRATLPDIRAIMPKGITVKEIFDQSIFVKASLFGVVREAGIAAGLTAMMIMLFIGSWRSTLIICISIPLSILIGVTGLWALGHTLNIMTLGGFALAVGILVDDATVEIENIERNLGLRPLDEAVIESSREIGIPAMVSTLSICLVFAPIFLLHGTPKHLFSPLALAVVFSMMASYILSRTIVPLMFQKMNEKLQHTHQSHAHGQPKQAKNAFHAIHVGFERLFNQFRDEYRHVLAWSLHHSKRTVATFLAAVVALALLLPFIGEDFFPHVDAGQMRLHVRAPAGTKIEQTQEMFALVEREIRRLVGDDQIDMMIDNIGLPYSGINVSLSDSATVGPMDGEILLSLKEGHRPTPGFKKLLRKELPGKFPGMTFFFQPADIVNQVLNFGQQSPIDIRVNGPRGGDNLIKAREILADLRKVPGIVDAHIFQVPDAPTMKVDVDRTLAGEMGLNQRDISDNVLVSLSSSAMVAPNFWLNPTNAVSYPLVVQTPQHMVENVEQLMSMPVVSADSTGRPMLMSIAKVNRGVAPMLLSQVNISPVFDVHADVQGTDMGSVARAISKILDNRKPEQGSAMHVAVAGQIETMRESFAGLAGGIVMSVVLVYLLMVINFQSFLDPAIVLLAVPFALAGVILMLFTTGTHLSVPALMGALMCVGLSTANSTLIVSFANQRMQAGDDALKAAVAAGFTRLRPVLMTAGAMMLGMLPMALGLGEGGEQNAPLGRAVIGGLTFATVSTLIFVPTIYRLIKGRQPAAEPQYNEPSSIVG